MGSKSLSSLKIFVSRRASELLKKTILELMQITHVVSGVGKLFLSQEHPSPITRPEFFSGSGYPDDV
jgi:hypothetical protein